MNVNRRNSFLQATILSSRNDPTVMLWKAFASVAINTAGRINDTISLKFEDVEKVVIKGIPTYRVRIMRSKQSTVQQESMCSKPFGMITTYLTKISKKPKEGIQNHTE